MHAGEATAEYLEGLSKDLHKQTWKLTENEQNAIDWPSIEQTFSCPAGIESLELAMRAL